MPRTNRGGRRSALCNVTAVTSPHWSTCNLLRAASAGSEREGSTSVLRSSEDQGRGGARPEDPAMWQGGDQGPAPSRAVVSTARVAVGLAAIDSCCPCLYTRTAAIHVAEPQKEIQA